MTNNIDYSAGIELLHSSEKIVITTHLNPDGDAVGSVLALYNLAIDLGKEVLMLIPEGELLKNLKFLKNSKKIKIYNSEIHNNYILLADTIFLLDLSDISRIKNMAATVINSPAKKVLIDHHIIMNKFADVNFSNPAASSTGELIYHFIKQAKGKINQDTAEAIYTAIHTDTGGFRFSSTTSNLHKIVAELLDFGAKPDYIYEKLYNNESPAKMKLQGLALSSMEHYLAGKLTVIAVTNEMFAKTGTIDKDTEGFSQIPLTVEHTTVGILLVELKEKSEIRVSLRSKNEINVREIAAKYNGGGHLNAAGCRLQEISLDEAKKLIIKEVSNIL